MTEKLHPPKFLLSLVKNEEDFIRVAESGLTPSDFESHEKIYNFMREYWHRFKTFPNRSLLNQQFPNAFITVEADLEYAIDEMRKYASARRSQIAITKNLSGELDLSGLIANLEDARRLQHESSAHYTDSNALERNEEWNAVRARAGSNSRTLFGVRTGIRSLDETRHGWKRGDLVTIYGRPEAGKSWLLLNFGVNAWLSGKKVLLISPEMSTQECEYRIDALIAGKRNIEVSHRDLPFGQGIDPDALRSIHEEMAQRKDWRTVDGKTPLDEITSLVMEEEPLIVLIDGIALLNGSGEQEWVRFHNTSYGLKALAADTKTIVICVNQAIRDERLVTRPPTPVDMAHGDAIVRASDKLIAIFNPDEAQSSRAIQVQKDRAGGWFELRGQPIFLHWDVNLGEVYERI